MIASPAISVRVANTKDNPRLAWADGLDVTLPVDAAAALSDATKYRNADASELPQRAASASAFRLRAAFTETSPTSTRLPFSYQAVPLWARTAIGHLIGRLQRARTHSWAAFPRWPLDLSADFLADLYDLPRSPFADGPTPVLLSHDIDTPEGLRNLVHLFHPIEEAAGASSSNYIVPCAWPIDHALLGESATRGHEVGIHGYDHSNRTPFAPPAERQQRVAAARPLIDRYGILGYRAPSLLRTPQLIEELATLYRYDSSIPTSGGLFPVPNNGCASARPFFLGDIMEIPLTMPRDGSLRFLGYGPREILGIWRECAERIASSGGVVSLLTHCEQRFSGNPSMLDSYRRFLDFLAGDQRFAFATPASVMQIAGATSVAV
jgi:peptidoglycan/xylan/chitin deacetylase (PgdA/CDA1 family)